jgi:hypothetical protein
MMPTAGDSTDTNAIESAYQEQIQVLFKMLVTNIVDGGNNQKALAKFTAGLNVTRQAKQLALGAIGSAAPAMAMMSRGKRAKGK